MSNRQAYIDRVAQLNACKTAEEVANLLREAGVKGEKFNINPEPLSCRCALARDFQRFEPDARVGALSTWAISSAENAGIKIGLKDPVQDFIYKWDSGDYPDLEA